MLVSLFVCVCVSQSLGCCVERGSESIELAGRMGLAPVESRQLKPSDTCVRLRLRRSPSEARMGSSVLSSGNIMSYERRISVSISWVRLCVRVFERLEFHSFGAKLGSILAISPIRHTHESLAQKRFVHFGIARNLLAAYFVSSAQAKFG